MNDNDLNEIYYETSTLDANATTVARIKQFSLGTLYLLWAIEASQTMVDKESENTLPVFALFAEEFFDNLNDEVKEVTISALKNLADALEYREKN